MIQSTLEQSAAVPLTNPADQLALRVPSQPIDAREGPPRAALEELTTGRAQTLRTETKLVINAKWFWADIGGDQTSRRS